MAPPKKKQCTAATAPAAHGPDGHVPDTAAAQTVELQPGQRAARQKAVNYQAHVSCSEEELMSESTSEFGSDDAEAEEESEEEGEEEEGWEDEAASGEWDGPEEEEEAGSEGVHGMDGLAGSQQAPVQPGVCVLDPRRPGVRIIKGRHPTVYLPDPVFVQLFGTRFSKSAWPQGIPVRMRLQVAGTPSGQSSGQQPTQALQQALLAWHGAASFACKVQRFSFSAVSGKAITHWKLTSPGTYPPTAPGNLRAVKHPAELVVHVTRAAGHAHAACSAGKGVAGTCAPVPRARAKEGASSNPVLGCSLSNMGKAQAEWFLGGPLPAPDDDADPPQLSITFKLTAAAGGSSSRQGAGDGGAVLPKEPVVFSLESIEKKEAGRLVPRYRLCRVDGARLTHDDARCFQLTGVRRQTSEHDEQPVRIELEVEPRADAAAYRARRQEQKAAALAQRDADNSEQAAARMPEHRAGTLGKRKRITGGGQGREAGRSGQGRSRAAASGCEREVEEFEAGGLGEQEDMMGVAPDAAAVHVSPQQQLAGATEGNAAAGHGARHRDPPPGMHAGAVRAQEGRRGPQSQQPGFTAARQPTAGASGRRAGVHGVGPGSAAGAPGAHQSAHIRGMGRPVQGAGPQLGGLAQVAAAPQAGAAFGPDPQSWMQARVDAQQAAHAEQLAQRNAVIAEHAIQLQQLQAQVERLKGEQQASAAAWEAERQRLEQARAEQQAAAQHTGSLHQERGAGVELGTTNVQQGQQEASVPLAAASSQCQSAGAGQHAINDQAKLTGRAEDAGVAHNNHIAAGVSHDAVEGCGQGSGRSIACVVQPGAAAGQAAAAAHVAPASEVAALREQVAQLTAQVTGLRARTADVQAKNTELQSQNTDLLQLMAKLEHAERGVATATGGARATAQQTGRAPAWAAPDLREHVAVLEAAEREADALILKQKAEIERLKEQLKQQDGKREEQQAELQQLSQARDAALAQAAAAAAAVAQFAAATAESAAGLQAQLRTAKAPEAHGVLSRRQLAPQSPSQPPAGPPSTPGHPQPPAAGQLGHPS